MPLTPVHMGPGILIKSIFQSSFSLMVFGWAQIVMDIQPLIVLLSGEGQLHGFSHTYIGASIIALFSAWSGKYLSEFGLLILGVAKKNNPIFISWWVVFISAFIGTFSHVFLDSIMHSDIEPFYPFFLENSMLKIISINQLHKLCLYSALVGTAIYYLLQIYFKKRNKN
jgi:hypothetical protein